MRQTILQEMEQNGITIDEKKLTDVNLLKRHVLKRCIYGVDLNPMAVELAKVSLWLDCFTLGAPLSFLDHHLRCGNSLIGVTVREVDEALSEESGTQFGLFETRFPELPAAIDAMRQVGELSDITNSQIGKSRAQYRKAEGLLAPLQRWLDVYTSQWFGNGIEGMRRRRTPDAQPIALTFLKQQEAQNFLMADTEVKLKRSIENLPSELREIADRSLAVAEGKRFFHWELEFPEVFYGSRPGTQRTIERLEGAGFDVVIGNPPYDELSQNALGRELDEAEFFRSADPYRTVGGGRLNWYHFFVLCAVRAVRQGGYHSFIVPMSLLADQFTRILRQSILSSYSFKLIEAFPQKDDPARRVFREAKLPTCLYVLQRTEPGEPFAVRVHPGAEVVPLSPGYSGTVAMLRLLDPMNLTIPLISETGWTMLHRIFQNPTIGRLRDVGAAPTSGEIIFNQAFRRYLTDDPRATLILRGSHVQRWEIVEEAKQGEPVYLKKAEYLRGANRESKAYHFQHPRVVYQECAAIDNWRRIIAAYLPAGNFCGHKICYFTDYQCAPLAFLAIFDSRLLDYVVTALSTNNSLPAYLIGSLPFPRFSVADDPPSRSACLSRLKQLYAVGTSEQTSSLIVEAIAKMETFGSCAPIAAHDFLAFLAEEMIALHKQKQILVKQFLSALEAELKIRPDREGNSGIDALSGKTTVKRYLGDYQKRESNLGFSDLWEVLGRNRMRVDRTLDQALENELRKQYSDNLASLLPIKSRLAATDQLIDKIVYQLYGVRDEEKAMIEAGCTDATPQLGRLVE